MQSLKLEPDWTFVCDRVMGGASSGAVSHETVAGREAARMTGRVSLDNDGGFIQIAFDLARGVKPEEWTGIELDLLGNDEAYDVRLRTTQLTRPWQSFRAEVVVPARWTRHRLPFAAFAPHRTEQTFDPASFRRIGLLAIGRVFEADLSVSYVGLYR
ncbi:MAG: CIA30 family protein [Pseudomonadota bacterium]